MAGGVAIRIACLQTDASTKRSFSDSRRDRIDEAIQILMRIPASSSDDSSMEL